MHARGWSSAPSGRTKRHGTASREAAHARTAAVHDTARERVRGAPWCLAKKKSIFLTPWAEGMTAQSPWPKRDRGEEGSLGRKVEKNRLLESLPRFFLSVFKKLRAFLFFVSSCSVASMYEPCGHPAGKHPVLMRNNRSLSLPLLPLPKDSGFFRTNRSEH